MTTARADRTEDLVEEWGAEPWQPLELSIVLRLDGTQQVLENENALLSIVNLTDSSYEVVWMCGLRGVEDASRCRRGPYDRLPRTRSCGCVDRAVWRMHRVAVADHTTGCLVRGHVDVSTVRCGGCIALPSRTIRTVGIHDSPPAVASTSGGVPAAAPAGTAARRALPRPGRGRCGG
ncbi:hypothetical protein CDCA_CDCA06G1903 [Cyanidium caldarium]|uniref:Uncharacterized protein n=1 Tax=Cyanidium caldarium TaxID=2771 RepID=A0AAV9IVQ1_CYACA|nr:hypothetical protein CDCA_CDCA06G1903 [Cyanidium caldarium]